MNLLRDFLGLTIAIGTLVYLASMSSHGLCQARPAPLVKPVACEVAR